MLFNKNYKIVETRKSGVVIVHYLNGKKKDIDKVIEAFKNKSWKYEMMGKNNMAVWVD